ncbi:ferritin-like domain-containing protein [Aureivirga marina]|uniref:ferritin-like domain-containing protein n=1 Tax=Aureivirga marina TaxID=1182451 RepID=UPI0018CBAC30|nr:ferritin-like protein [Aureivirga marina]
MQLNFQRHLSFILDEAPQNLRKRILLRGLQQEPTEHEKVVIPPEFNAKDWLSFLLYIDAELEHSLMIQYLYSAYSLGGSQVPEEDRELVKKWQEVILGIAKEEMGHFISVQNVLRLIGAPLNMGRQDYPWDSPFFPFEFALEPFSKESLAKYVFAESPVGWLDSPAENEEMKEIKDEIRAIIKMNDHGEPIALLFDKILRLLRDEDQIPDSIFQPKTYAFQAKFDEWGRGYRGGAKGNDENGAPRGTPDVLVMPLASRDDAIEAVEAIAEQGEDTSPIDDELSHFERFLGIYVELFRKKKENPDFEPARNVATNPIIYQENPSDDPVNAERDLETDLIKNPVGKAWANLFNIRYRMLLNFLSHSFLLDDGLNNTGAFTPRGAIVNATFGEMYNLRSISNVLVKIPLDPAVPNGKMAGPPFLIPYTLTLPFGEKNRWRIHQDTIEASLKTIEHLLKISDPSNHKYLNSLKEADRKLYELADKITLVPTNY